MNEIHQLLDDLGGLGPPPHATECNSGAQHSETTLPEQLGPVLRFIGTVESPLTSTVEAPKQGSEGAPDVWIAIHSEFAPGLAGLEVGAQLIVITWLDRADRGLLQVHPRDNPQNSLTGVFRTRSADRPNPIGLHPVRLHAIDGNRLRVGPLEAVDGTPVLDLKPAL